MSSNDSVFAHIAPISGEFERALLEGDNPAFSDYLNRVDASDRGWLIEDLIRIDMRYSKSLDLPECKRGYLAAYPDYDHQIDIVFRELEVARPLSGNNLETKAPGRRVAASSDGFAGTSDPQSSGNFDETHALVAPSPSVSGRDGMPRIGKYKLLQQIGRGGMGSVWMAEQEHPVVRRVAIKVIREEYVTPTVVARFEVERQALAMMDHPHIASVLDGGETDDGHPYFVMELVRGIPFNQYCDKNHLSLRERLELFIPLCRAVHHAHQKSIIHRDIKPSNVLVAINDGKPFSKIIDFGLAKALDSKLTNKTLVTEFGQVMGTLLYMSPEQADYSCLDVDTRTDIYSLGVMLYELLTGTTPIDDEHTDVSRDQVLSLIRDVDPPRPSNRLSESLNSVKVSKLRQSETSRLHGVLRGDLDWIVMKAIEKDRTRRYESASDLADDIARFLRNEPVEARPPSYLYLAQKLVRRHRVACAMSAVVAASALASVGALGYSYREVSAAKTALVTKNGELDEVNEKVRSVSGQLSEVKFRHAGALAERDQAVLEATDALRSSEQAEQASAKAHTQLASAKRELAEAEMQKTQTVAQLKEAVAQKVAEQKQLEQVRREKSEVARARDEAIKESAAALESAKLATTEAHRQYRRAEVVKTLMTHGILGHTDDAPNPDTPIVTVLQRTSDRINEGGFDSNFEADIRHTLGFAFLEFGHLDKAKPHVERAYELRRQALEQKPAAEQAAVYESLFNLARYHERAGNVSAAADEFERVVLWREQFGKSNMAAVLRARSALADAFVKLNDYDRAEFEYRKIVYQFRRLSDDRVAMDVILQAMEDLALMIAANGGDAKKLAQGTMLLEEAIKYREERYGVKPKQSTLKLLAKLFLDQGDTQGVARIRDQLDQAGE